MHLLELPDLLIKKGIPFAIYSYPNKKEFNLIAQKNKSLCQIQLEDINNYSGYFIAAFNSATTGTVNLITPDFFKTEGETNDDIVDYTTGFDTTGDLHFQKNVVINEEEYTTNVEYLINQIQSGKMEKIVFSRVINKKLDRKLNLRSLLSMLREKYKSAFVSLFHIPGDGTWFGVSPESLFRMVDNYYITDSLAGTKVVKDLEGEPKWSNKELIEQQLVSNFIESVFSELDITTFKKNGPNTVIAGNLYHIHTSFRIFKRSANRMEGRIIAGLFPTPAVCGLPKADAFNLIQRAERHERRYYTGFIGPWNLNGQSQLFVNLRCGELGEGELNLYVGGGLTDQSIPADEFTETIHKSRTLLSVVENL